MEAGDVIYGVETSFGSGTTDKVRLLRKVPDPSTGEGAALRTEFEEEDFLELVQAGTASVTGPTRLSVENGGTIRTTMFPFGNIDAFLENVLWSEFSMLDGLRNGSERKSVVVKTIAANALHQVFTGAMLQQMTINLTRSGDNFRAETELRITSMGYEVGADVTIGPDEEAAVAADNLSGTDLHYVSEVRFHPAAGAELVFPSTASLSTYLRPALLEMRGLGSMAPQDFSLAAAPLECGGQVRFALDEGSDHLLRQFIGQEVYDFRFEVRERGTLHHDRGYLFFFPRVVFRQGWVTPPADASSFSYNTVEWIATQDPDSGIPAVQVTKV